MEKIVSISLAMVMLIAVPCVAFDFPGHEGQIPLCQNNKTGVFRFAPVKNSVPTCNTKLLKGTTTPTETLIWASPGMQGPPGPQGPKGDKGDTGSQGPAGVTNGLSRVVYANLNSDGTIISSSGISAVKHESTGVYAVTFTTPFTTYPECQLFEEISIWQNMQFHLRNMSYTTGPTGYTGVTIYTATYDFVNLSAYSPTVYAFDTQVEPNPTDMYVYFVCFQQQNDKLLPPHNRNCVSNIHARTRLRITIKL